MEGFDIDGYLADRAAGAQQESVRGKENIIDQRAQQKREDLQRTQERKKQALDILEHRSKAQDGSWVNQAGLDPTSIRGRAVNTGAAFVSGGSRTIGSMLSSSLNVGSAGALSTVSDEARAAHARIQNGEGTDADRALMDQPVGGDAQEQPFQPEVEGQVQEIVQPEEAQERNDSQGGMTHQEAIEASESLRETGSKITEFFDITGIINTESREDFSKDIQESSEFGLEQLSNSIASFQDQDFTDAASETVSGLASLLWNVPQDMMSNPQAMGEYVAENLPQIMAGAVSKSLLAAEVIGFSAEGVSAGVQKHMEENDGRLPDRDTHRYMATNAAAGAIAQYIGTSSILRNMKASKPKSTATGFKASSGTVATNTARATRDETIAEGIETYTQGESRLEPVSGSDIIEGMAIGGATGGVVTGSGSLVNELSGQGEGVQEQNRQNREAVSTLEQAAESGNIEKFSNPDNAKDYAPDKAIAALALRNQRHAESPEEIEANNEEMQRIYKELDDAIADRKAVEREKTEEGIQELKDNLDKHIKTRDALPQDATEKRAEQDEVIEILQQDIDQAQVADPKEQQRGREVIAALEKAQNSARETMDYYRESTEPTQQEAQTLVSEVQAAPEQTTVQDQSKAADRLIRSSMSNPDLLSSSDAQAMANNTQNALSTQQRDYLRSFSESRLADNKNKTDDTVRDNIVHGTDGFKGIKQHRSDLRSSLDSNDQKGAARKVEGIKNFARSHRSKANALKQAQAEVNSGRARTMDVVRDENDPTSWRAQPSQGVIEKLRKGGNLRVDKSSARMLRNVESEANRLEATANEMQKAYNTQFEGDVGPSVTTTTQTTESQTDVDAQLDEQADAFASEQQDVETELNQQGSVTDEGQETSQRQEDTRSEAPTTQPSDTEAVTDTQQDQSTQQSETKDATEAETETQTETEEAGPERTEPEPQPQLTEQQRLEQEQAQKDQGKLNVFKGTFERVKGNVGTQTLKSFNSVKNYLFQDSGKSKKTSSPLATEDSFLANMLAQKQAEDSLKKLYSYLPKDNSLTNEQRQQQVVAMREFFRQARQWNKAIDENLPEKKEAFTTDDFIHDLMDENGQIDENIKTAISYAVFSYIGEQGNSSYANTDQTINTHLGREDDALVTHDERVHFGDFSLNDKALADALGSRIGQALQINSYPDAPKNVKEQFKAMLGMRAVTLMIDQGLLERHMVQLYKNDATGERSIYPGQNRTKMDLIPHVRLKRNKVEGERFKQLPETSQRIVDTNKGSKGVINTLFKADSFGNEASFAAQKYDQKNPTNSNQNIAESLRSILKGENKKANYLRKDMVNFFNNANAAQSGLVERLAGALDPETDTIHKANRLGNDGRNQGLAKEAQNMAEFIEQAQNSEQGLDSPIFFNRSVKVQNRVHLDTSNVNPQQSKLQRHMVYMKSWDQKITLNNKDGSLSQLKLAIADSLGIKTDEMSNKKAVQNLNEKVRDTKEIRDAIDALKKYKNNQGLTEADYMAVERGVKQGGEDFHSLDGLMNLAEMEVTQETPNKGSFQTQMMREVDGKTNGPMFAFLQTGGALNAQVLIETLNRGGFYEIGNTNNNYYEWRSRKGNKDVYENLIGDIVSDLSHKTDEITGSITDIMGGLLHESGDRKGTVKSSARKIVKTPIQAMVFGSSVPKAIDSIADDFVQKIYDRIVDIHIESSLSLNERRQQITQLNQQVNSIMQSRRPHVKLLPEKATSTQMLETVLTDNQVEAVKEAFNERIGKSIEKIIGDQHQTFLDLRNQSNRGANMAFELYEAAYQTLRAQEVERLRQNGELADAPPKEKGQQREAIQDISKEKETEIRERIKHLEPVVHSAFSKMSDDLSSGIYLGKHTQHPSTKAAYQGEIKIKNRVIPGDGKLVKSVASRALEGEPVAPGAGAFVKALHSSESATVALSYFNGEGLNVHDAIGWGVMHSEQMAQEMNKNTFKVQSEYSVPLEMFDALQRTLDGFYELMQELENPTDIAAGYNRLRQDLWGNLGKEDKKRINNINDVIWKITEEMYQTAMFSRRQQLEVMKQLKTVDQFSMEKGQYEVTDTDRERIAELEQETQARDVEALLNRIKEMDTLAGEIKSDERQRRNKKDRAHLKPEPAELTPAYMDLQSDVAATLKEFTKNERKRLTDKRRNGQSLEQREITGFNKLRNIAAAYAREGNLDSALERSLPGTSLNYRNKWKERIQQQQKGRTINTRSITDAPKPTVMNLIHQLTTHESLDQSLKDAMDFVALDMSFNGKTFNQSLKENTDLSTLDAARIRNTLNRFYNSNRQSPWGELGLPMNNTDADLVQFMEETPNLTVGKLINKLQQRLASEPANQANRFNRALLARLKKTTNASVPIRYLTEDSAYDLDPPKSESRSKGWFESSDTDSITIRGPDFVESGVSMELMLHELTHSALTRMVDNVEKGTVNDPQAKELVDELNVLRDKAEQAIEADESLRAKYGPAIENVNELIAWGMTNRGFQSEVLNQIEMQSTTQDNALITGIQKFIETVRKVLFGKGTKTEQQVQSNGLNILISNTAGLFEGVKNHKDRSTGHSIVNRQQESDSLNEAQQYTTEQIYDDLESMNQDPMDSTYSDHLRKVLNTVVRKVHGPMGMFKQQAQQRHEAFSAADVYLNAVKNKQLPFSSKVMGQNFRISEQEAFVLEQVEASTKEAMTDSTSVHKEVRKLFNETRQRLSADDFLPSGVTRANASPQEMNLAQEQYDFIFRPDGSPDHMARFMALGLAYKPLRDLLDAPTQVNQVSLRNMRFGEALQYLFSKLMDALDQRFARTHEGQNADAKLDSLMDSLVNIESKKRAKLASNPTNAMDRLDDHMRASGQKVRGKVNEFASSKVFKDRKLAAVRAMGSVTSTIAGERVTHVIEGINRARGIHESNKQTFLTSMINEAKGPSDNAGLMGHQLLRMANKNEQERFRINQNTAEVLIESFENQGKDLTRDDKAALNKAFMKTDMAALRDYFTMDQLLDLMDPNSQSIDREIGNLENQLKQFKNDGNYYREASEQAGFAMATGRMSGEAVMRNAHNIASAYLSSREGQISQQQMDQAQPVIDQLVSLYAVKYTDTKSKRLAHEVFKRENSRGQQSGVEMLLDLHKQFQKDSMERLFGNNPIQMQKGYTREIYNPYKQIKVASLKDGEALEAQGWVKMTDSAMRQDPHDPDTNPLRGDAKHIYVIRDGGMKKWVTGSVAYSGEHAQGSSVHSGLTLSDQKGVNPVNQRLNQEIRQNKQAELDRMFQPGRQFDPWKVSQNRNFMAPILDSDGNAVNWRYMMSEANKDTILDRNNQVDEVMGAMAANVFDKQSTKEQNRKVVEALHEQYKAEALTKPNSFMTISPNSADAASREIWRKLPEDTKQAVRDTWGKNEMKVRADLMDMTFGYRKYSLSEMYDKNSQERWIQEKILVGMTEAFLGEKAALRVTQAEDIVQEVIKEMKDILVIKNVTTFLGNTSSNISQLLWMGMKPTDIVRHHITAIRGTREYTRMNKEMRKLQVLVDTDNLQGRDLTQIQDRIVELQSELDQNPIKELVDHGLFQTIVEDIDSLDDDHYTYKSQAVRKVSGLTDRLPESVKKAGKAIYMSHDTPAYQFMKDATFMSDFAARYALHQHMTSRENNPMSRQDSLQLASEAFVNFDVPTHKGMQYMNDMGLIWFTKYYIRIQKMILMMLRDNPARSLSMVTFNAMMPSVPTLQETAMIGRLGNPLSDSALSAPGLIDELPAIKLGMGFFQ